MGKFFTNKWILSLALVALAGTLVWISHGIPILDRRFSYSPYEAIGFFAELTPENSQRLRIFLALDLLLFIPIYSRLFFLCTTESGRIRSLLLVLLTIGTTADIFETFLELLGSFDIGWADGWLPQALSMSTPTKWIALTLWGFSNLLLFVRRRFG